MIRTNKHTNEWNESLSKLQKQCWVFPHSPWISAVLVLKQQLLSVQPSSFKTSLEQLFNEQLDGAKWWENRRKFHQKPNYMSCKLWWVTLVAELQVCDCCCRGCSLLLLLFESSRRSCRSLILSCQQGKVEEKSEMFYSIFTLTDRSNSLLNKQLSVSGVTWRLWVQPAGEQWVQVWASVFRPSGEPETSAETQTRDTHRHKHKHTASTTWRRWSPLSYKTHMLAVQGLMSYSQ